MNFKMLQRGGNDSPGSSSVGTLHIFTYIETITWIQTSQFHGQCQALQIYSLP